VVTAEGTFAWMLSRVDNVLGDSTTLSWSHNPSGRLLLAEVHWGGRGDGTQYQLAFAYEPVEHPFLTYQSGEPQQLDQHVTQVTLGVKQGGSYAVRWRYELAYTASSTGPAFYLHQITKRFASGATEPPVTYDYDLNTELWAQTALVHTESLDDFIASNGSTALQPDRAALMDLEEDGLLDLETSFDQTTVRQTAPATVSSRYQLRPERPIRRAGRRRRRSTSRGGSPVCTAALWNRRWWCFRRSGSVGRRASWSAIGWARRCTTRAFRTTGS